MLDVKTGIIKLPTGEFFYPRPFYRIGDILESTNPNNPADDGYIGIWELYGKGRVTVCVDNSDVDFNSISKILGEKNHTLTVDEMPTHEHYIMGNTSTTRSPGTGAYQLDGAFDGYANGNTITLYKNAWLAKANGGNQVHNNIQPSIVVYRWRRIA